MNNADGNTQITKGKKLGVVTWFGGTNYGTNFQAFALLKVLQDYGYDAKAIRCRVNPCSKMSRARIELMLSYLGLLRLVWATRKALFWPLSRRKKLNAFGQERQI